MSRILPPPPCSAGVPITCTRPFGSRSRTAASAAPAPTPAAAMTLTARVPDAGQRVVLAQDRDRRSLAGLDGRAKRRVDAGHAALELESVLVEKLREPRRCLDLLIPELGMIVDLARQRLEVGGKAVNGGPDQVFDGAHGESPEVSVRPRLARPTPTIHRRSWLGRLGHDQGAQERAAENEPSRHTCEKRKQHASRPTAATRVKNFSQSRELLVAPSRSPRYPPCACQSKPRRCFLCGGTC